MKIENEAPTNLRTVDVQKKSVSLAWDSPENTYGLDGYIIYKDNKKVGEVSTRSN
ncbi:fibronectin type III domain-containing protein [Clostridium perfringens]|nr:fibronectin type III domain-containing protein [Clostridium perfringens]